MNQTKSLFIAASTAAALALTACGGKTGGTDRKDAENASILDSNEEIEEVLDSETELPDSDEPAESYSAHSAVR